MGMPKLSKLAIVTFGKPVLQSCDIYVLSLPPPFDIETSCDFRTAAPRATMESLREKFTGRVTS